MRKTRPATPPPRSLSLRAFARDLGVTLSTVQRAIREGRIPSAKKLAGKWTIPDAEQAKAEWAALSRPYVNAKGGAKLTSSKSAKVVSIAEANLARIKAQTKLLELEHARKAGRLLDAEVVRRTAFEEARIVRDTLLNIPARVAAELAAETDAAAVQARLEVEIRQALEGLAHA